MTTKVSSVSNYYNRSFPFWFNADRACYISDPTKCLMVPRKNPYVCQWCDRPDRKISFSDELDSPAIWRDYIHSLFDTVYDLCFNHEQRFTMDSGRIRVTPTICDDVSCWVKAIDAWIAHGEIKQFLFFG